MKFKTMNCFLCVDKPPPRDLKKHIMFYHMVENDEAVEKIFNMHSYCEQVATQTTVTWTSEFSYYDHRAEYIADKPTLTSVDRQPRKRKRLDQSIESVGVDSSIKNEHIKLSPGKKVKYQKRKAVRTSNDDWLQVIESETVKTKITGEEWVTNERDTFKAVNGDCTINVETENKEQNLNEEVDGSVAGNVIDFFDYEETATSDLVNHQTDSSFNKAVISNVTKDEDHDLNNVVRKVGKSISVLNIQNSRSGSEEQVDQREEKEAEFTISNPNQEVEAEEEDSGLKDHSIWKEEIKSFVKKFGNSISILNVKASNNTQNSEYVEQEDPEKEKEFENSLANEEEETLKSNEVTQTEEVLDTDKVTNLYGAKRDDDRRDNESSSSNMVDIQEVAEKLGISISVTDSKLRKGDSSERSNQSLREKNISSPIHRTCSSYLASLVENGTISLGKFVNKDKDKEDLPRDDNYLQESDEINDENVDSEKEEREDNDDTFLSFDEENGPLETPLARLVNCGSLSINKIEESDVHEVAGRPVKQSMCVSATDSSSSSEEIGIGTENSSFMKDEAFNSDEEFDDDDY